MNDADELAPEQLTPEQQAAQDGLEQALAQANAQNEFLIKVMFQPTTAAVSKFEDGRRILTMTQQGVEVTIPFGPDEAEQLSKELHVSPVQSVSPAEAKAAGVVLPS